MKMLTIFIVYTVKWFGLEFDIQVAYTSNSKIRILYIMFPFASHMALYPFRKSAGIKDACCEYLCSMPRPKGLKRSKLKSGEKMFDLGDTNQCIKKVIPIVDN